LDKLYQKSEFSIFLKKRKKRKKRKERKDKRGKERKRKERKERKKERERIQKSKFVQTQILPSRFQKLIRKA
jgi:hypothetical protein